MGWLSPGGWLDSVMSWLAVHILDAFDAIFAAIAHGLLLSPNVTGLPQVQALTGRAVWVVETVFVLAFIAAGVLTMLAGGDERSRYTVKDLMPRLVVGFIAAHFSPLLIGEAIGVANGLTGALAPGDVDQPGALAAIRSHLHDADNHITPMLFVVLAALVTVLLATTLVGMLGRLATLIVLGAAAPLALACHALPQTDPVARLWWRGFGGCLVIPVLQAMLLQAGQWMLEDPGHILPELGVPDDPGGVLNLFIVVVLLWYTARIPGWVGRYVSQGQGRGILGTVVRVVVVQQLTRKLVSR
jgi:hypothetical protein